MRPSLEERIEWFGNRLFPVFSRTVVGRLRSDQETKGPEPKADQRAADDPANAPSWPGFLLDSQTGHLVAQGYGLVVLEDQGLKLTPLFKISKDRLTLKATLYHQDFQGEAVQVKDIEQAILALGLQVSVDLKTVKRHLKMARKLQSSQPDVPVATGGVPPVEPRDAVVELSGDSRYPVFSGNIVGRATEPVQASTGRGIDGAALEPAQTREPQELQIPERAGWTFDPQTRRITAKGYGMVVCVDGRMKIKPLFQISENRCQLSATIYHRDFLGQAVTVDRMRRELAQTGVTAEVELEALSMALKSAVKSKEPQTSVILARGLPPHKGCQSRLSLCRESEELSSAQEPAACIDFHERRLFQTVQPGDLVARILGGAPGTPGRDIFGQPVPGHVDPPVQVRLGTNVAAVRNNRPVKLSDQAPHSDDALTGQGDQDAQAVHDEQRSRPATQGDIVSEPGTEVYATASGVVAWDGTTISVAELLEIKGDVDYSTGNIELDKGSVSIQGTVQSGFAVQAPGDILVGGTIEDARVTAGGDCLVKGGIVHDASGLVRAGGNVQASFAENATIETDGDVSIDNDMTNCRVTAQGMIRVSAGKGTLQGGTITSNHGVEVSTIGSEHGIKTLIILGSGIRPDPGLSRERERVRAQIGKIEAALGTEEAHVILSRLPEPRRAKVARLITHKTSLDKRLKELDQQIRTQKERDLEAALSSRVTVLKTAFPGTEVRIGGRALSLTDPLQGGVVFLDRDSQAVRAEPFGTPACPGQS